MNLENVNKWLTLLGNLAVLAGIVFLAAEISQNTSMMQSQTRNAMTENQMSFYALIIENPDVQELFMRGGGSSETSMYEATELSKLSFLLNSQLRMWENEWYQYSQGLYDAEEFEPRLGIWKREMRNGRHQAFWTFWRDTYSPGFRSLIDEYVNETN